MTLLDWGIIAVVGFFFIRGLFRGFFVELFALLALVAGYFAARLGGPPVALYLTHHTPLSRWIAGILAAILLFVIADLLVQLLGRMLRNVMRTLALGGFDRLFGALFASAKAIVVILLVMFLLALTPWSGAIGNYTRSGRVSPWFWIGTQMVQEAAGVNPIAPTQAMAKWLRAAGFNEEVVHIITDRPDLMLSMLNYARENDIQIPVSQILGGEPAVNLPDSMLKLSEEQQAKLVHLLEDTTLTAHEQAKRFWMTLDLGGKND